MSDDVTKVPILEAVDVGDQIESEGYLVIGRNDPSMQWFAVSAGDLRLTADEALRDVARHWKGYEFRVLRIRVPMPVNLVAEKE